MRGGKLRRVCHAYVYGRAGGSSHTRFTFISQTSAPYHTLPARQSVPVSQRAAPGGVITSFLSQACFLWQLGNIPAPSEGFDRQYAGIHAAAKNVHIIAFVRQRNRLRVDYVQVRIHATFIAVRE